MNTLVDEHKELKQGEKDLKTEASKRMLEEQTFVRKACKLEKQVREKKETFREKKDEL